MNIRINKRLFLKVVFKTPLRLALWSIALVTIALLFLSLGAGPLQAEPSAEELDKINTLLEALSTKTELTFVRNDKNYKVGRAVSHLKSKLKSARTKISTCQEFIDHVASKSSFSGKPYLIIKDDGSVVQAREYFNDLQKEIESKKSHLANKTTLGHNVQILNYPKNGLLPISYGPMTKFSNISLTIYISNHHIYLSTSNLGFLCHHGFFNTQIS
jgi:hypothetical protein